MSEVSYPIDARPNLKMNHIDGPMLSLRDGQVYWLSWWDRIQLLLGKTDVNKLERKYWKHA